MFICGSGGFSNQDEGSGRGGEVEAAYGSPCSTPKRSRRSTSFCKLMNRDGGNKNPYADRGLDKFYALLADLDDKKQKIYTQKGAEEISFVRFVYANDSDNVKPIVVKVKEKEKSPPPPPELVRNLAEQSSFKTDAAAAPPPEGKKAVKKKRSLRCKGSFKLEDLKRPHFLFPVMVVLILLLLAVYGRSFAILCTSIGWYLAPTISGGSTAAASSERKPKRKKEYVRKKSEKMAAAVNGESHPSSPKSVINGLNRAQQQQQQQQQHDPKRSCR